MTVSIVIPHYGADLLLHDCLAVLDPTVETIVVNNNPGPAPRSWTVVIDNDENVGFARACNQGAANASGDRLVFLNNDTIAQPGWLDRLDTALDEHPLVGARLLYPDGRVQHAGVDIRDEAGILVAYNRRRGLIDHPEPARPVDAVTGACLAIRRDLWDQLDGFDEGFVNGYEDVDLCLRAGGAWYEPRAVLIHRESASGPVRWSHVRENVARLQEKHGWLTTIS